MPDVALTFVTSGIADANRECLLQVLGVRLETLRAFRSPLVYSNCRYEVVAVHCSGKSIKIPVLLSFLGKHDLFRQQGIIICNIAEHVKEVIAALSLVPECARIQFIALHGKLSEEQRLQNLVAWRLDGARVAVCTVC